MIVFTHRMIVFTHRGSPRHEAFLDAWLACAGYIAIEDALWHLVNVALYVQADAFVWTLFPAAPIGHA